MLDYNNSHHQRSDFDNQAFKFLAISPFGSPDIKLCLSWVRQGAAAALDLGHHVANWPELLQKVARNSSGLLGVRISCPDRLDPQQVPQTIPFIVLPAATDLQRWQALPVIVQVTSLEEAIIARQQGAAGIIATGAEAGGRISEESCFILLQRILSDERFADMPVWAQGGMGMHTAPAAIAGGAFGVVLDSQLALLSDCSVDKNFKQQLKKFDGTESIQLHGQAVYSHVPSLSKGERQPLTLEAMHHALEAGELIALGQDAALAEILATDAGNCENLLHNLRSAVSGHIRQAKALHSLSESSPLARQHGTRYPIAQGPMTRVSDTAEFAKAVADNGGLPFLALSLMNEASCEQLLDKTQALLEQQSWGVGVLGFAPAEVLQPQLALISRYKPNVVLVAGGRPSQARALEEQGIQAYLHVPAPGLLDMFLKDGARSFVFEGRECGGHIGPRYSFVLWEQQLTRLMAFDHPEELNILFAGGIHEERSAAMVATAAAALAARGAKIGVLMGSAYIATEEATATGAVNETFQREVISSDTTRLLETAPGHAIRGLDTAFADYFHQEKSRLQAQGLDKQAVWAKLEELNLGRLRLATKGLERVAGELVYRDEQQQREQGMYMIGQLAAMRNRVCRMDELHSAVTTGAMNWLKALPQPHFEPSGAEAPIAIVGMDCIYPGSPDLETFWANILEGKDFVREVSAERWNSALYHNVSDKDRTPSKWGGFIDDFPFDPLEYGIPPQSLAAIDPVQLLSLEVAKRALLDAGYADDLSDLHRDKTSVIFGAESGADLSNAYTFRNQYKQFLGEMPQELDEALPSLTEDSFPGVLVNVIAGRIANRLDLGGVNYTVDSACASSLTAVELAVKELRSGSSDVVLAGGADFHNGINDYLMFASVGALSATGKCKSFDNEADGIALGEGIGVVVLKRLQDAERDGDRIYAVIDGIAGSSDGKSLGLTAPRKEGQKRALTRAYQQAGVLPGDIGLVEAHGTGTVVGDRTELATLTEIFSNGGALNQQTALGSVKSQIGHTKCAAGLAGLIKISKALYHRILPPTQNITTPNAYYRKENSPFMLEKQPRPWLHQQPRAAISAFGFGGTNFHAVLSAYQHEKTIDAEQQTVSAGIESYAQWPAELFVFSGASAVDAQRAIQQTLEFVDGEVDHALRDVSYSLWQSSQADEAGPVQCALVAQDKAELVTLLRKALQQQSDDAIFYRQELSPGKVAFLFPGQGSQSPGMLRDIFLAFPDLRDILQTGASWVPALYPCTAYDGEQRKTQQAAITDTRVAQPTLGMVDTAMQRVLGKLGLSADMMAGHSYGELVALASAGAMSFKDLLALSAARGESILAAADNDPGRMAAVSTDRETLATLLAPLTDVVLANQNSPRQTVISGPSEAIEKALQLLQSHNIAARPIEVACAFHSPVVAAAEQKLADYLTLIDIRSPAVTVYSNLTADVYPTAAADIKRQLAEHVVNPVRFVDQIEAMYAAGARTFVEVGPGRTLTGMVNSILADKPHRCIATDRKGESGVRVLLQALAELITSGQSLDLDYLFAHRAVKQLDLSEPVALAKTTWWVNGSRAKPMLGEAPAHAGKTLVQPLQIAAENAPAVVTPELPAEGQMVAQYLNNVRDMVHAQRDVMMGLLGASATAQPQLSSAAGATVLPFKAAAPQSEVQAVQAPATAAANSAVAEIPKKDLQATLIDIVSDRTGYPADMLDLDLDLEADLSIDSIKRVEIIGQLVESMQYKDQLQTSSDELMEQLATKKTLREIIAWLNEQAPVTADAVAAHPVTSTPTHSVADVKSVLLEIVSERTGYPTDVLELDLDLEADLSIDSIKRLEIVGELTERLQLQDAVADKDAAMESLAALKTLRAMVQWLDEQTIENTEPSVNTATVVQDVSSVLLSIVAARTGYPTDVLDLDLDLEADLSIDSIKRLEIVGELAEQLQLGEAVADKDAAMETLAALKTLRAMVQWLNEQANGETSTETLVTTQGTSEQQLGETSSDPQAIALSRYIMKVTPTDDVVKGGWAFEGKHFLMTDDSLGVANKLKALLEAQGATVAFVDFQDKQLDLDALGPVDGLIHLASLNPRARVRDVRRFFNLVRRCLLDDMSYLLVASGLGGSLGYFEQATGTAAGDFGHGSGMAGMVKSIAKEFPAVRSHWVDLDLNDSADELAAYLELELLAENPLTEVGYQAGIRRGVEVVEQALTDAHGQDELNLDHNSVLLITGGAQGITAKVAIAMAKRYGCQLELVGRSPLPEGEEPEVFREAEDLISLRKLIIAREKGLTPAEVERRCSGILRARSMRQTCEEIIAAGGRVNYHSLDVRDIDAFGALIEQLYEKYQRIDGVIHGAGIVEDKLLRHKTSESFERVYDTKVRGALMLSKLIRDDVKFVVFFSSVAGAFGNRGQVDYATANDTLDKIAHSMQARLKGRVLSVNWGPWAEMGMVSEELEREYMRKGIGLIPVAEGVEALIRELRHGKREDAQVVLMCASAESMR